MYGIRQYISETQNGSLNIQPESFEAGKTRQTEGEITKSNCSGNKCRIEKNAWQPGNSQKGTDDAKEFDVTGTDPSECERKNQCGDSDKEP